jgi:hypothetical protein
VLTAGVPSNVHVTDVVPMVLTRHETESDTTSARTAEQSTLLPPVPSANVSVTRGSAVIEPEPDVIVTTPLESLGLSLTTHFDGHEVPVPQPLLTAKSLAVTALPPQ